MDFLRDVGALAVFAAALVVVNPLGDVIDRQPGRFAISAKLRTQAPTAHRRTNATPGRQVSPPARPVERQFAPSATSNQAPFVHGAP